MFSGLAGYLGFYIGEKRAENQYLPYIKMTNRLLGDELLSEFIEVQELESFIENGEISKLENKLKEKKRISANIIYSQCEENKDCEFTYPILYQENMEEIKKIAVESKVQLKKAREERLKN
jgi:type IV secretory pathway component VirB8